MQPMMPDDRRSLTLRLRCCSIGLATVFASSLSRSGFSRSPITRSSARWRTTTTCSGSRCRRRAECSRPGRKVLVNNQSTTNIVLVREQTKDLERTCRSLAGPPASTSAAREEVRRRRREPSYRPIVLIENATARAARCGERRASWNCRASSARTYPPVVHGQRHGGSPVRLRRGGAGRAAAAA